jgi:hypothetical protein
MTSPDGRITDALGRVHRSGDDPGLRPVDHDTIKARIDWAPDEPNYHLFEFDVDAAGFVIFGKDGHGLAWNPAGGLRRWSIAE